MIPKNIHMIWLQSWANLPQKFHANVKSIVEKNPNWKIYYWDDLSIREELKQLGQKYLDKYDSFELLHNKVDYGRIGLLYKYGGAAIDTDVVAIKGFDSTPNIDTSNFIVSEKPHSKSINNATILASQSNPILKHLLDNIDTTPCRQYESDYQCIQRTTGPYAFNKLLKNFRDQITVLDKSFLEPCASLDPYCEIKENSVLDHRHELSWLKPWHKEVIKTYFIAKHYKYQLVIGLIIIILIVIALNRNN